MATGMIIGLIVLAAFLVLLFYGVPIAVSMALCGVVGSMFLLKTPGASFTFLSNSVQSTFTSYGMAVIPMFMLMGELASESGIGPNMFDSLQKMLGRRKGSLASAVQVVCAIFGAICGSGGATAAMMCRVAYPQMKKHGYADSLSTGSIASGSCLATLIPPSTLLLTYGLTVEESIGKLFAGGILTGVILMTLFIITVRIWAKINPNIAPDGVKTTLKEKWKAFKEGCFLELLIVFGISMGGMFAGWFTPTEAGSVGVAAMLLVTVIFKRFSWKMLLRAGENTLIACGMMYCLLAGANVFGKFFTLTQIPTTLGAVVAGAHMSPVGIIMMITVIYLVLGCFIDALPLMLLTAPIFLPIVQSLGYNAVWFGCYIVVLMGLAAITPPVGVSCYLVSGFCDGVPMQTVFKGSLPFIAAFVVMGLLMAFIPELATWIPNLMMGT